MPLAWFICPYKIANDDTGIYRYPSIMDLEAQIFADNGIFEWSEVLGNAALVKVRASATTLTSINQLANVLRIPSHTNLSDTLGDLTANQRTAILNEILSLGYSQAEIDAVLPANWQNVTLGQVLHFISSRRFQIQSIDFDTQISLFNQQQLSCRPVTEVDNQVN